MGGIPYRPHRGRSGTGGAAEAHAARTADHRRRAELLTAVRMLRRIDQAVVGFATDLGGVRPGGGLGTTVTGTSRR